jgi:F-box/WD-40 domain protein MET30
VQELQRESQVDQQSIANVWSLFSAAPSRHRNLMLQGILAQCCFPQLSFISSSVRSLIKIDFLSALPTELGFKILCYLDTSSLCNAAQVSRRWRQLADDDVVWHRMCEQHIDRKCTKCGWGLPLLDQRRLRNEKRKIELRASGRALNETSSEATHTVKAMEPPTILTDRTSTTTGTKRACPEDADASSSETSKRSCTNADTTCDQLATYFDQPKKRPWKDVYKDRFKVGKNWKDGKYTTKIFKGHTNGVMCLQFDDQVLMTGSYDATIKIWDIKTGEEIRTLTGHTQGIRCLQFTESTLITGSLDNTIKMWNWRTGELMRTLPGHSNGVIGLHYAGKLLASGSSDNTILIHDFNSWGRKRLSGHRDWVNSVKIDLQSRTLFSASDDMTVKLWDLDTNMCLNARTDTSDTASLASDSGNFSFLKRSLSSSSQERSSFFPNDPDRPNPPSYMLTGSLDGTIGLWHVPSGREVHRFLGHIEGIWSLAADSLRLVSGAEDKTIKIWDPRTGKNEGTMVGHTGPVTCVGVSDSRIASGSEDGTVRVHCFV